MGYINLPASSHDTRPRVLVVDDESAIRRCIALVLQEECQIQEAETVDDAIDAYSSFRPDLVIIDYDMPIKKGLVGIEFIRSKSLTVPIICLSGNTGLEIRKQMIAAGANVFMEKPFNLLELTGKVYEEIHAYQKGL